MVGDPDKSDDDFFKVHLDSHVNAIITDLFFRKKVPSNINKMKLKKKIKESIFDFKEREGEGDRIIKPWKWLVSKEGEEYYKKIIKLVASRYKEQAEAAERRQKGIDPLPMQDGQQDQSGGGELML
jgi:hypothetical protein